jgi:FkbM family methyltransferase
MFVEFIFSKYYGSMVHAGTFYGDMLPTFSSYVSSNVYAFEPVLENYVLAKICAAKNNLENVLLFNCGLGSSVENLRINTTEGNGQHAGGASKIDANG